MAEIPLAFWISHFTTEKISDESLLCQHCSTKAYVCPAQARVSCVRGALGLNFLQQAGMLPR